jgi:hypothetical protein
MALEQNGIDLMLTLSNLEKEASTIKREATFGFQYKKTKAG